MNKPIDTAPERVEDPLTAALTGLPFGALRPPAPTRRPMEHSAMRGTAAPLALMVATPVASVLFWIACFHHDGSILALLSAGPSAWAAGFPLPSLAAVAVIVGWTAFQALLLQWLPGERFLGPITPAGVQPEYRLNGVAAWVVSHALVVGAWALGLYEANTFYEMYGSILITLTVGAFAFCGFLYFKGLNYPTSPDNKYTGNLIYDFYNGIELHPRLFGLNLKQLINCRFSMMWWSVTFVVFSLAQLERHGAISTAMIASTTVLVVYLFKFFWWEGGYFHSLDIMHDHFGYYICWGVLAWVPAVYCLPALWLVDHPIDWHPMVAAAMVGLGLLGIWINFQADDQRQRVRATKGNTTVWGSKPETITASYVTADGEHRTSLLLVSGWWGVARHFHYVPELTLAAAWTMPAGFTHFLPWFYWVFLLILLVDRANRDEKRCSAKYGEDWKVYTDRVPWKIVPGLY